MRISITGYRSIIPSAMRLCSNSYENAVGPTCGWTKRVASRQIFALQGLPGVGPVLAMRLLHHLGSVERVVTADVETLSQVRGVGQKKAARIRELVG